MRNVGPETDLGNGPRNALNLPDSNRPNAPKALRYGKTGTGLMVVKVKVKLTLEQLMKAQRGSISIALLFL